MNENEIQPLLDPPTDEQMAEAQKAYQEIMGHPLMNALQQSFQEANRHKHGPFVFLLNQNHNALRGCTTCGAAWVGSMAGSENNLRWHAVKESSEMEAAEEEE